jgi:hypothetical protein
MRTSGEHDADAPPRDVPAFVPALTATLAFAAPFALAALTRKRRFCRDLPAWRGGRVAEGGGLLNLSSALTKPHYP